MADSSRRFDKKLYNLAALEAALEIYADFATMTLDRAGEAWTVTFDDVDADFEAETIASEFANYVLAGTVQGSR
jgi:hypothetical protein